MSDRTGHPILGGMFLAMQALALNALGLFSTAYIIRRLGALHYGEWATAAALATAHLIVTNVGLRPVFVRAVARQPGRAAALLAEQLGVRIMLGILAAGSAMAICVLLGYPPVVLACMGVGCVWILLSAIASTLGDVLQALEQFGGFAVVSLIAGLIVTAASIAAVAAGCGPVGLSVAYLTAPAMNVWLYARVARRHVRIGLRWDLRRAAALLRESRMVGISQIAAAARDRAESLLVPRLVGLEAFGVFSAGSIVADRLGYVPDAICTAFYPRISRAGASCSSVDTDSGLSTAPQHAFGTSLDAIVTNLLTLGLAASIPLSIIGTYLAPALAAILLPASRDVCRRVIEISVWAVPLLAMSYGLTFSLQAAGHHDRVARVGLWSTGASAILAIGLTVTFGIEGASWSLLARPAMVAIALLPAFRRTFPTVLPAVPLARILLSASTLAAICFVTHRQQLVPALACAICGVAAYALALMAARVVAPSAMMRLLMPSTSISTTS
jgi:O-antigen/teichoic acid export membrane protein